MILLHLGLRQDVAQLKGLKVWPQAEADRLARIRQCHRMQKLTTKRVTLPHDHPTTVDAYVGR